MTLTPTPTISAGLPQRRADFATLPEALDYAARGTTGLNFFSARGELTAVLSYRELRERSQDLAVRLVNFGLAKGDRMVLVADTEPDFCITFLACQYAGILPVPVAVPTSLGGHAAYVTQLRHQIVGCDAVVAWAPESLLKFLREAAEGLPLKLVGGPSVFAELPRGQGDLRPFGASEPGYLQFSSGSTRFPKGIDIPQRVFMANAGAIVVDGLRARSGDRCTSWLPFYHDMGLVGFLLVPLMAQLSVDYMATRDFARRSLTWLKLLSDHGGTLSYSPSFGYELCTKRLRDGSNFSVDLSRWRAAGIGGDMVQHGVLDRFVAAFGAYGFRKAAFVPSYGMAETTLAMSFAPLEDEYTLDYIDRDALEMHEARAAVPGPDSRGFVACGRALIGHEFQIRDTAGNLLADRQIGKIFFRGPSVMTGYFRQPDLTREALSPEGWLDTGDLGYTLNGQIVITGRAKDLIIINGRNIWPQDLEWTAEEALSDLRRGDVAAFSIDESGETEHIVVLVQCRSTDPETRAKLQSDVAAVLQKSMAVEARVILVAPHALPQTSSGKLSRARAKANYLTGAYAEGGATATG